MGLFDWTGDASGAQMQKLKMPDRPEYGTPEYDEWLANTKKRMSPFPAGDPRWDRIRRLPGVHQQAYLGK